MKLIILISFISVIVVIGQQNNLSDSTKISEIKVEQSILIEKDFLQKNLDSFLTYNSADYKVGKVIGGTLLGTGFSSLCSIPTLFLAAMTTFPTGSGISNHPSQKKTDPFLYVMLGATSVVMIITSAAVPYWLSKSDNPNLSWWKTVEYSAIGFGASASIIAICTKYKDQLNIPDHIPALYVVGVMMLPSIVASLYTVSDGAWETENQQVFIDRSIHTHKDYYEQTKLFNIEVARIKF